MQRRHRRVAINITSLIDVMFLLVIFLTVSTTFRHRFGVDLVLPEAETATLHNMSPHEITVDAAGDFYFGQQRLDDEGLRAAIAALLQQKPETVLVLRADEKADFGRALRAIDIVRQVGGAKLVVPTRSPRAAPSSAPSG